ncbi:hypothetical protein NOVO_08695 [Rickettsiales bacterium Ac37b]|nr:hypothetical protein NOVO_08695 [Rickettsiales bacterium Ac37b]
MEKELINEIITEILQDQQNQALSLINKIADSSMRSRVIETIKHQTKGSPSLIAVKYYDFLFTDNHIRLYKSFQHSLEKANQNLQNNFTENKSLLAELEKCYKEIFNNIYNSVELYKEALDLIENTIHTTLQLPIFDNFIKNCIIKTEESYRFLINTPNIKKLAHLQDKSILDSAWNIMEVQKSLLEHYMKTHGNLTLEYPTIDLETYRCVYQPMAISDIINLNNSRSNVINTRLLIHERELTYQEDTVLIKDSLDSGDQLLFQKKYNEAYDQYHQTKEIAKELNLNRWIFWSSYKIVVNCYTQLSELYEMHGKNKSNNLFEKQQATFYNLLINAEEIANYLLEEHSWYLEYNFDYEMQDFYIKHSKLTLETLINTCSVTTNFSQKSNKPIIEYLSYNVSIINKLLSNLVAHNIEDIQLDLLGTNSVTYNVQELLAHYSQKLTYLDQITSSNKISETKEPSTQKDKSASWEQKISNERIAEKMASLSL